jgi:hypothetical protein
MFGDWEWLEHRQDRQAARFAGWLGEVNRPVVVEVGAGTSIPAVRHLSQQIIHDFGGRLVRINSTEFSVPTNWMWGWRVGQEMLWRQLTGFCAWGQVSDD